MCTADKRFKLIIMALAIAALTQFAGCASVRIDARTGSRDVPQGFTTGSVTTSQVQVSGGTGVGVAIVVGVLVADGLRYLRFWRDDASAALSARAEAAASRSPGAVPAPRINTQNCAWPIDMAAGNLRCR